MTTIRTLTENTARFLGDMRREAALEVQRGLDFHQAAKAGGGRGQARQPDRWVRLVADADPATPALVPGGSATAYILDYDSSVPEYSDGESQTTIYDVEFQNFGLANDRFRVTLNPASGLWEIIGSWGVTDIQVKADAAIANGGSGVCSIWRNGSDTAINLTAHYSWATGSAESVALGEECLVYYDRARDRFEIKKRDGAGGGPIQVVLTQTGGSQGSATTAATYTYTVKDLDGNTLETGVDPTASPSICTNPISPGLVTPATGGLAFVNPDGTVRVVSWNCSIPGAAC